LRDNGAGFTFDEQELRAAGRLGLLVSVRARIEQLGGEVVVRGRPGRGAEIELRLP
jgi:signal transduction histidine kinase